MMVWQVKITVFQQRRIRGPRSRNEDRPPSLWGMVGQGLEAGGGGDTPYTNLARPHHPAL